MFTRRQKRLIDTLRREGGWVKGSELAEKLEVTSRTIRNDIGAINTFSVGLVQSSAEGYRLCATAPLPDGLAHSDRFASQQERINYILSRLLISPDEMDLYDLADELYVSYQTMEKDARKMEQRLAAFDLTLEKQACIARVIGSERNRRRMLSELVYSEVNDQLHELISYQSYFEDEELYVIKRIMLEVFAQEGVSSNEYAVGALVLHLGIALSRIRLGGIIGDDRYDNDSIDGYEEFQLAKKVALRLEAELGVTIPRQEVCSLAYNLLGKTRQDYSSFTADTITQVIDPDVVALARLLLSEVEETYGFKLYEDNSFIRFVVHIRDLLIRLRNGQGIKNPMKSELKHTYPMIYDVAVLMAARLNEQDGYHISEEEIAYLAIHVGSSLEQLRSKETEERIGFLIISPQFFAAAESMRRAMERKRSSSTYFSALRDDIPGDLRDYQELLILSTVDLSSLPKRPGQQVVRVNPMLIESDFERIDHAIAAINEFKSREAFLHSGLGWFRPGLFFRNVKVANEWEAIDFLGNELVKQGVVEPGYLEGVRHRERLSSTTYGSNFAIPHSTKMDAKETAIAVLLSDTPIPWGDFTVNLIFFIAIEFEQRKRFGAFYDQLAGTLIRREYVARLQTARDYDEFLAILEEIL